MIVLVYGGNGFIGKYIISELKKNNITYILSSNRIYNYQSVISDLNNYQPTHIISAAGFSTPTNIDYYESNVENLILTNTTGNLILADVSYRFNIHVTLIMSGCIYSYLDNAYSHPKNIFDETALPNFTGSMYSTNRISTEYLLSYYHNICILRLRMPISNDMHPKSLITKIVNYKTVINIPNSMSVLEDVMPFINIAITERLTGIYNLVNTGIISHPHILKLYQLYVNPYYTYSIISEEKQNEKLIAHRSNCHLSNKKISNYMKVPHIAKSITNIFVDMKRTVDKYHLF